MKPELITIGSCTLDCILSIDDVLRFELFEKEMIKKYTAIEYSRKLNIEGVRFVPGGSAANIASNCSMLGLKSTYIGILGDDFSAQICIEDMKERGVDLSQVKQTEKDNTALSVILKTDWGKDRSILAYKGANNLLTPEDVNPELFDEIKAFAWTSLTEDKACKAIDKAITLTRENGGMVLAAPSMSIIKNNPKWAKILIQKSDCISLNREEALEFTQESDTINAISHFSDLGLDLVSITNGSKGSFVSDGETIVRSDVYDGDVEDTTGAGDAFLSGLLICCLRDIPLSRAARIASSMALFESQEVGVREGIPTDFSTLEEFIDSHDLRQNISKFVPS